MTLTLPPPTATQRLTLDTTPPALSVVGPVEVEPPDELELSIAASEPVEVSAVFIDPVERTPLGVEETGPLTYRLAIPSTGLASGVGTVEVAARDLAGNLAVYEREVSVLRPRPFDIYPWAQAAFGVGTASPHTWQVACSTAAAYDVSPEAERTYSVLTEAQPAYDVETSDD